MAESEMFDEFTTMDGDIEWERWFDDKYITWGEGVFSMASDSFLSRHITPEDMDRVRKRTIADTWQRDLVEHMGRIIGRRAKKKAPRCEGHF